MADRSRQHIEEEYEKFALNLRTTTTPNYDLDKMEMQGLLLEVLLDIRDELKNKDVNPKWGSKL